MISIAFFNNKAARRQVEAEDEASRVGLGTTVRRDGGETHGDRTTSGDTVGRDDGSRPAPAQQPRRFHGSVELDATRVGRDASRIAEEVITHLTGLVGAEVRVTLEIEAVVPDGAPEHVVRTVTENSRTLKFAQHGFEKE